MIRCASSAPRNSFLPGRSPRTFPYLNVLENEEAVQVEALAPGLNPESIQINVLRNQLTIAGEKPGIANVQEEKYHRNERASGKFIRTIAFPTEVDEARVNAEYRNGILRISSPKAEAAKPRKISSVAVA